MKILAFNASPRKGQGVTDVLMNTFLESTISARAPAFNRTVKPHNRP